MVNRLTALPWTGCVLAPLIRQVSRAQSDRGRSTCDRHLARSAGSLCCRPGRDTDRRRGQWRSARVVGELRGQLSAGQRRRVGADRLLGHTGSARPCSLRRGSLPTPCWAALIRVTALQAAWQGLQTDSAIQTAARATVAGAVNSWVTDSGLVSALGATATNLVTELAGYADVRDVIGRLPRPTYGPSVVGILADPSSVRQFNKQLARQPRMPSSICSRGRRSTRRRSSRWQVRWPRARWSPCWATRPPRS